MMIAMRVLTGVFTLAIGSVPALAEEHTLPTKLPVDVPVPHSPSAAYFANATFNTEAFFPDKPFSPQVEPKLEQLAPEPQHVAVLEDKRIYKNGYELKLVESFDVQGRVISTRRYWGDERADIAPVDLAVGWGKLSDPEVLKQIYFRQNNRFLYWRVGEYPIPRKELEHSTTNIHIIPANEAIEAKVKELKRGEIVKLKGYLVDAKTGNNDVWQTSRSREDVGDGACEILLVEAIETKASSSE